MKSLNLIRAAKAANEDRLLDLPGVTGVDVGPKIVKGKKTDGLSPLALADLSKFNPSQQQRLGAGLRQLIRRYDLVVFDAGIARESSSVAFLASLADKVLVVTPKRNAVTGLSRLQAMDAARRFEAKDTRANIVETSAG